MKFLRQKISRQKNLGTLITWKELVLLPFLKLFNYIRNIFSFLNQNLKKYLSGR